MSEEQCSLVYNSVYQVVHGRILPTSLNLSAATELYTKASTSTHVPVPLIQQNSVTNYQSDVDLDAKFSNHEEEIVSINSEEFTERDNNTKEHV
ncbi:unnamed protein product [Schistosoma mattheei]|uniref:Uncharacterized protein n=1 Tax=Schistosoma mattheei TaxID=31246 RepID=A0A183PKF9_9TREM|nr:unnamed protein product [Schistosoma mattheei]